MAKTILIKGADFSANKVATVDFDRVHTTDIEIESSVSMESLGATHQITYTLTPSNSGDPIQWSSSDTSVCTVNDSGVVTAVGCGTATITATSNGHSDTCSVSNTNIELTGFSRAIRTGVVPNNSSGHAATVDTYLGTSGTNDDMYLAMLDTDSTKQKLNVCYMLAVKNNETNKYEILDSYDDYPGYKRILDNIGYPVPIKVPNGCTSIKMVGLNAHYAPYIMWYKSDTRANSSDENQLYFSAYKKSSPTLGNYSWTYQQETTASVESGYDSFTILWKADTANGATNFANLTEEQIASFKVYCS